MGAVLRTTEQCLGYGYIGRTSGHIGAPLSSGPGSACLGLARLVDGVLHALRVAGNVMLQILLSMLQALLHLQR